ncbi:MAG: carotenoid biosynthesis protein [Planctomycetota bacterium]
MSWLLEATDGLLHSLVHRPYTFLLFGLYALIATWHLGLYRSAAMTLAGYGIAWLSEVSSINNGFPYGWYSYLDAALEGDLRVAGVPFFDSLSYSFLVYFSWTTASLLLHGVHRSGRFDYSLAETPGARRSLGTLLLAACLTTWLDVLLDPVTLLGEHWFLGQIYEYPEVGAYFGVPLSNFGGWLLTSMAIALAYAGIDRLGDRRPARGARRVPAQGLLGLAGYLSVTLFALGIAVALGESRLALVGMLLHLPVWIWVGLRIRRPLTPPPPDPDRP